MCSRDVEDGKSGVDLSGLLGDFPAVNPAPEVDIGNKRAVFDGSPMDADFAPM